MTAAHTPPPPPPPPSSSCYRSPQRTPNTATSNNYASTHTPILSAKRPKKWSASPKSTHTVAASSTTTTPSMSSSLSSPPTTPEMMGKLKKKLHATTLSPMHNVRPVPKDSHHVAPTATTNSNYSAPSSATTTAAATSASLSTSTSATKDAAIDNARHEPRSKKKHALTMIEELEVSSSINETTTAPTNSPNDGGDVNDEEGDGNAEIASNNDGPSSASWVGRKVDAIFSPVLSFLSGTTTSTTANATSGVALSTPAEEEEDDDDDDEGKFLQRSPTTQSSTYLESNSGSYMQDNEEEENANNDITATSSSIAAALAAARRSSTNSSSSVTTVVDVDGDVTMAENNYKLHYRYTEEEEEEVVTTTTTTRYHDEESPPTPDKYTISSSRTNEEGGGRVGYNNDANHANTNDDDDDDDEEFNPYLFIKCLPPYHYATPPGWISRPKALPPPNYTSHPPTPPICLVLDLDETLVHCTVEAVPDADMVFPVEFHGVEYLVHVRCRPYLREFLEMVHEKFEVVIFTASQQVYADKLLDKIDPEGKFIRHRMFRDSCLPVEGNFLKDLNILGRDLSKAILVDNSPHAFGYQVDNGIPIESWFDDPTDKELLKLELFLRTLHGVEDVREVVRKTFQTHQLVLEA